MAVVDLPPGARSRTWILLLVTFMIGCSTYWVYGQQEILLITVLMVCVMLYLLAGVRWSLDFQQTLYTPLLKEIIQRYPKQDGEDTYWCIVANDGVILQLTDSGCEGFGHQRKTLLQQKITDLLPRNPSDPAMLASCNELLLFGSLGHPRESEITIVGEFEGQRRIKISAMPLQYKDLRRAALVMINGEQL